MRFDRAKLLAAIGTAAVLSGPVAGRAAKTPAYPARPIKVYVPFAAGGGSDTWVRVIQKAIADHQLLPEPLAIINLEGAGATIGSRRVKDAPPDGYTILQLHEAIMTAQAMGKVRYGPEAFEPIAATGEVGLLLVVSTESPYRMLGELLAAAKARPETLAYAANLGAPSHYAGLLLEQAYPGAKFRFVNYGGGEARFAALKGGHIQMTLFSVEEYRRYRTIGLRALASFGAERHPALPEVPTAREQGVDVAFSNIDYWWAPKGTPPERIAVIANALEAAMQTPQVQEQLAARHSNPIFLRDEPLRQLIESRQQRLSAVSSQTTLVLPNFAAIVIGVLGALLIAVGAESWLGRRSRTATPNPDAAGETRPRIDLALGTIGLTILYVGAMAAGLAGYRVATTAFVLALGLTLGGRRLQTAVLSSTIGLLLGPGLHFLLTRVFFVDLP